MDLYADNDFQDNNSCASDNDWKIEENAQKDLKKLEFEIDIVVDDNEIEDLNNEDAIYLNDGLADDNNADIEDIGVVNKHDNQHNYFGAPDNNLPTTIEPTFWKKGSLEFVPVFSSVLVLL